MNFQAKHSLNEPGTCERSLFECDLQLVEDTYYNRHVWNSDYHLFWSQTGFDPKDPGSPHCKTPVHNPDEPTKELKRTCCGGHDRPLVWKIWDESDPTCVIP